MSQNSAAVANGASWRPCSPPPPNDNTENHIPFNFLALAFRVWHASEQNQWKESFPFIRTANLIYFSLIWALISLRGIRRHACARPPGIPASRRHSPLIFPRLIIIRAFKKIYNPNKKKQKKTLIIFRTQNRANKARP